MIFGKAALFTIGLVLRGNMEQEDPNKKKKTHTTQTPNKILGSQK